jgi:hypothetical protein
MVFSDTVTNLGLVQQVRDMMRVDATQWSTTKIVNSANNYSDMVAGYLIATDKKFQWDNTNHSKLPEGTTDIVSGQSDYSFLTDEQGNAILTLTRVEISGKQLELIDQNEDETTGTYKYDKIADNIIRLYPTPTAEVTAGLKFYFQRVSPRFSASDTTATTGFAPILDRGFVIACAYDGALTLGLPNLQPLSVEREREEQKMIRYYSALRNRDAKSRMLPNVENNK